jgi:thiol-disulfide isomerase/thioredoxin
MKHYLILVLLFLFANTCFSQVLLKGRIIDKNIPTIFVYQPIDGFCNRELAKPEFQIKPDKAGYFKHQINIDFPVAITLRIGSTPVFLVVEPNDTIDLHLNMPQYTQAPASKAGITISGKNGNGNMLYNTFEYRPLTFFSHFEKILDSANFRKTFDINSIDNALSQIVQPFDSLYSRGEITKPFHDVVVNDTKGILLTQVLKFIFFDEPFDLDSQLTFVHKLYEKYPVDEQMLRSEFHQSTIAYYYYYSKARKYFSNSKLDDSTLSVKGKTIFVNKDVVPWLFAPKAVQDFEWANNLVSLKRLFSSVYGERDVDAFLTLNPESKMKKFLTPPYFAFTTNPTVKNDTTSFKFLNSDTLNSFESLLSHFRGEKLFVDFWATWCMPCKMEFAYNEKIDEFCARNNIKRLYVAFEMADTKKNVKKTVSSYELMGYHVVASKKLIEDIIRRFYPGNDTYTIPRYLLVNKKGEVVDDNAPRPSSGRKLLTQMKLDLK